MEDRSPTWVRDLAEKLEYLLKVRGGDVSGWKHRRVTSQRLLSQALSEMRVPTDEPTIARWKRHGDIPNLVRVAPKIAEIFNCDEASFRREDYITFVEKTEGKQVSWDQLVASAAVVGSIAEMSSPTHAQPHMQMRVAIPTDVRFDDEELPSLPRGARIAAVLPVPQLQALRMSGSIRHVLLFSGDRDGYLNWLPRFRSSKAFFNLEAIGPSVNEIRLPSLGGELKLTEQSSDRHDIVLVVSGDPLPPGLRGALEAPVQNAGLRDALESLTRWLVPRLTSGEAAICHRPYFVEANAAT